MKPMSRLSFPGARAGVPLAVVLSQAGRAELCRRAWLVKVGLFRKSNAIRLQSLGRFPRFLEIKNLDGGGKEKKQF